jgi:hypothetical protein
MQLLPTISLKHYELLNFPIHQNLIVLENVADYPPDVDDFTHFRTYHVLLFVKEEITEPFVVAG